MIAIHTSQLPIAPASDQFLKMLPGIRRYARLALRQLRAEEREEAIQEVVAAAFCAFGRLVELGREDLAYPTPLARYALARFRSGRRVGSRYGSGDVCSQIAQRQRGFSLQSLTAWAEDLADNTSTPVIDQVIFRLDFPAWLGRQSRSQQKLAQFLLVGNTPAEAAQRFGVSRARICQLRGKLRASWQAFQADAPPPSRSTGTSKERRSCAWVQDKS